MAEEKKNDEDQKDKKAVYDFRKNEEKQLKMDLGDFQLGDKLGEGSFSQVFVGTLKSRIREDHPLRSFGKEFALKTVNKRSIQINRQSAKYIAAILREKRALYQCQDIYFVNKIYATAQNNESVCFIMEFCKNGDLSLILSKNGALDNDCIRYYSSCLIHTINILHGRNMVHRDIKPENVMLNDLYEPKLIDFGCVKIIPDNNENENEEQSKNNKDPDFVGTPEFMAPELININDDKVIIKNENYKCLDFWSLGCFIYQIATNSLLFTAQSEYLIFKLIHDMKFTLDKIKDEKLKDLLQQLLQRDPLKRLGVANIDHLKNHEFFEGVDWDNLEKTRSPLLKQ